MEKVLEIEGWTRADVGVWVRFVVLFDQKLVSLQDLKDEIFYMVKPGHPLHISMKTLILGSKVEGA